MLPLLIVVPVSDRPLLCCGREGTNDSYVQSFVSYIDPPTNPSPRAVTLMLDRCLTLSAVGAAAASACVVGSRTYCSRGEPSRPIGWSGRAWIRQSVRKRLTTGKHGTAPARTLSLYVQTDLTSRPPTPPRKHPKAGRFGRRGICPPWLYRRLSAECQGSPIWGRPSRRSFSQ